jgi:hypothetical protein
VERKHEDFRRCFAPFRLFGRADFLKEHQTSGTSAGRITNISFSALPCQLLGPESIGLNQTVIITTACLNAQQYRFLGPKSICIVEAVNISELDSVRSTPSHQCLYISEQNRMREIPGSSKMLFRLTFSPSVFDLNDRS